MNPIVTRKQIVLSVLFGLAVGTGLFFRTKAHDSDLSFNIANSVIFGFASWLVAFLSLRPRPKLETEAEKRGRILGKKIAFGIALLSIIGLQVWTSIAPSHIR